MSSKLFKTDSFSVIFIRFYVDFCSICILQLAISHTVCANQQDNCLFNRVSLSAL
jgi:hypothetical protein